MADCIESHGGKPTCLGGLWFRVGVPPKRQPSRESSLDRKIYTHTHTCGEMTCYPSARMSSKVLRRK